MITQGNEMAVLAHIDNGNGAADTMLEHQAMVLNWLACVNVSVSKGKAMEPMSVNDMVADARTRIQGLSMEEMQRELEEGKAIIVDIRDVRERWRDGTIPGSKHVARGMLEFWADPQSEYHKRYMDPEKRTIVYCAGGLRSSLAADVLQKLGYKNVAHLEMGYDAWKKAGGAWEEVPVPSELRKG